MRRIFSLLFCCFFMFFCANSAFAVKAKKFKIRPEFIEYVGFCAEEVVNSKDGSEIFVSGEEDIVKLNETDIPELVASYAEETSLSFGNLTVVGDGVYVTSGGTTLLFYEQIGYDDWSGYVVGILDDNIKKIQTTEASTIILSENGVDAYSGLGKDFDSGSKESIFSGQVKDIMISGQYLFITYGTTVRVFSLDDFIQMDAFSFGSGEIQKLLPLENGVLIIAGRGIYTIDEDLAYTKLLNYGARYITGAVLKGKYLYLTQYDCLIKINLHSGKMKIASANGESFNSLAIVGDRLLIGTCLGVEAIKLP